MHVAVARGFYLILAFWNSTVLAGVVVFVELANEVNVPMFVPSEIMHQAQALSLVWSATSID